ncbi:class I SAM-dependent methyltransferase [Halobacteriales archaeon QS_1_68_20]|nr:MAG: class I SAM-dependent methyltransferase [Halobacteriales archaeon QS_1_68_20]
MTSERWVRLYEERDYERRSYLEGEEMTTYATRFFEEVGVPETMASVGCGPAVTEFELAERFPETTFACSDVSEQVIEDNRELAAEHGLDNITFEVAALPDLDLGRTFDVVYCVATLYFVEDVEAATRSLFDHVADGGYLVVSYPTEGLREWASGLDDFEQSFFEPVLDGRNLTTAAEIESWLDASVESYWSVADADVEPETACIQK